MGTLNGACDSLCNIIMSGFSIQLSSLANVYDEVSEPEQSSLGNYDDIAIMHI